MIEKNISIHPLSDVHTHIIGKGTRIWQYAVILEHAQIGEDCNINAHTFIEGDVILGNRVTVKSGVYLWNGARIADNVFIGPNATFVNDLKPRSREYPEHFAKIIIDEGASLGANCTILGGRHIGSFSLIGAGALVTKDIPPFTLWYGSPAKHKGYITRSGIVLGLDLKDKITGQQYHLKGGEPIV